MANLTEPVLQRPRRRFRLRFSMRAVMIVITITCCCLGWHVHGARRQRAAVQTIQKYGGGPEYDYERSRGEYDRHGVSWVPDFAVQSLGIDFFHRVEAVHLEGKPSETAPLVLALVKPVSWDWMAALPELTDLSFFAIAVDDVALKHIGRYKGLKELHIEFGSEVTDVGIRHLASLRHLQYVYIGRSQITDASLEVFSQMPELKSLQLPSHHFTDKGANYLRRLKNLRVLFLSGKSDSTSAVTDDSLEFLLGFANFRELRVQNTRVSPAFVERFKAEFPRCKVTWGNSTSRDEL